jgi:hypothetical protein
MDAPKTQGERQMTPAAKVTYTLALVIGLVGGALFGHWRDSDLLKSYYSARKATAPMALEDFSLMQYRHADAEHARAAPLAYANLLEQLESVQQLKLQELQLTTTYIRLAMLEDTTNNLPASRDYMAKARSWYTASGGQNRSDSEMKAAVADWDARAESLGIRYPFVPAPK